MHRGRGALAALLILLATAAPAVGAEVPTEEPGLPILEAGVATARVEDRRVPLGYSVTTVGPLVALAPLVGALGGQLKIGPLGQSHELKVNEVAFVFGPDSPVATHGEEITALSQRPVAAADGLRVPLDLLETTYSELLGYDFLWDGREKLLTVSRSPSRDVPVEVDLVHLQGVTTVVLQFPFRPRYRVERRPGEVRVALIGDRLAPGRRRPLPGDRLVRDVALEGDTIRVALAPDAEAQDYVLRQPFRLVFDVYRRASAQAAAPVVPQKPSRSPGVQTIMIDPGHGGSNTGAIGASGVAEKDLALSIARALRNQLVSRLPVKVVLTREEDAELPLDTRTALANQQKADLFISLHLNSVPEASAHGAETYFLSLEASDERAARSAATENLAGGSEADPLYDLQLILWDLAQSRHLAASQRLANLIQEELNGALGLRDRGVKQAPFRVLMGAAMPAVLVELGFLSNPREEDLLQDPAHRAELVEALVRAVTRYRARASGEEMVAAEALP